jgi:hypothetical protein
MRLSTLRKYTFAAWNGLLDVTVPETLAVPDNSDCARASGSAGNTPHASIKSTANILALKRFMINSSLKR